MPEARTAFFIGDVALDDYFTAERWPDIADKALVREAKSYVGGMIANAASVHAGLGGRTEFISLLNDSQLSARLCMALNETGVSTRHMLHDPSLADSRNLIFLVGDEHVVLIIEMGNQPMQLTPEALAGLRTPGYLYMSLGRTKRLRAEGLQGRELLADFRRHGRKLILDLDVDGFSAGDLDYLHGADVLIMNQIGFGHAFGDIDLAGMNAWMRKHQVGMVIRTLAAAGAEAFDGQGRIEVRGYKVPVIDVTGAGDTFGGALTYALGENLSVPEALELAIAAASRAVAIEGPQGGVASLETIKRFRAEFAQKRS
ncbi:carbohydrate kinase family protein [Mesorhizobium sp. M7D.F.Ca.US.005.01.1.1]|uniref:carbohydrate kinase family protein n=1 Tax=Mesorhizobium sp. M7D.F.Ca.US.005.01.1.1 TaxID=2493678 RepID=UPI000F75F972|nr:carbohydrate kinase family protein [Mesorhizobium sp. M7D.F.Ca.US.005.01.1.1]AZO41758.1 carbohydrate kinase family protein [Mesorhizobium sp. M7D.F.Ca.US.005.01.1.1]